MKRFKNILFVVDSRMKVGDMLERAVTLAENNQASLTVVDVAECVTAGIGMPEGGPISIELQAALVDDHKQELELLVEPFRQRIEIQTNVLVGIPFLEVIREVLRNRRDLVIKIPQQQDWLDLVFGSDDMHLMRKCPCPVWLMNSSRSGPYRKIMAAVDFDPFDPKPADDVINRNILEMSTSLALTEFCELHIVHVWQAIGESGLRSGLVQELTADVDFYLEEMRVKHQLRLNELVAEFVDKFGDEVVDYLKPRVHLVKGLAKDVIPAMAKKYQIDLITMGTVGRTGIPGFLMGNTAETILNRINCSVLAIKPEGFVTLVTVD